MAQKIKIFESLVVEKKISKLKIFFQKMKLSKLHLECEFSHLKSSTNWMAAFSISSFGAYK